ncbi:tail fiber domain-containing protein [Candidatus Entotheonella palauensis]|uniref:tail fiber domain-containing protein n=1 Tax=Candidatus Entotheonella palauensis TaxID=93172 RepID=UPI000B7C59FA|nr:tail fiber domain-containing protein [Candidatus Entotheonella palauensis]
MQGTAQGLYKGIWGIILCVAMVVPAPLFAGRVTIPHTFSNGTVADADEVNANFTAIKDAIDDNDSRIDTIRDPWIVDDISGNIFYIGSSVGIGTMNPTAKLHIQGESLETETIFEPLFKLSGGTGTFAQFYREAHIEDQDVIKDYLGIEAYDQGNPSIKTAIVLQEFGGNVGIGTTTAPETTLHVQNGDDPTIKIQSDGVHELSGRLSLRQSNDTGVDIYYDGRSSLDGLKFEMFVRNESQSVPFYISNVSPTFGNVGIGTTDPQFQLHVDGSAGKPGGGSWSSASDRRLKKNIEDLDNVLDQLLRLRGVTFEYKNPDAIHELPRVQNGMIAQEVEKIFPQWVEEGANGYKLLTFRGFEALTVEALRELRDEKDAQIAALEARLAVLEQAVRGSSSLVPLFSSSVLASWPIVLGVLLVRLVLRRRWS